MESGVFDTVGVQSVLLVLGRRMEVEDGRAEATTKASGWLRVCRFDVVAQDGYVVTVFATMRAKGDAGVPWTFTYSPSKKIGKKFIQGSTKMAKVFVEYSPRH